MAELKEFKMTSSSFKLSGPESVDKTRSLTGLWDCLRSVNGCESVDGALCVAVSVPSRSCLSQGSRSAEFSSN